MVFVEAEPGEDYGIRLTSGSVKTKGDEAGAGDQGVPLWVGARVSVVIAYFLFFFPRNFSPSLFLFSSMSLGSSGGPLLAFVALHEGPGRGCQPAHNSDRRTARRRELDRDEAGDQGL